MTLGFCCRNCDLGRPCEKRRDITSPGVLYAAEAVEKLKRALVERDLEVARLRDCLAKANSNHEHFERLYYLTQDALDELLEQIRVQSPVTGCSDKLVDVMRRRYGREAEQWKANHEQRKQERDDLRARLALVEPVFEAAKAWADAPHVDDADHAAGDCDSCPARFAKHVFWRVFDAALVAEKERTP